MRTSAFLATLSIIFGSALAPAQTPPVTPMIPPPLARAEIDKRAYQSAYDTVALGADLFNAGNQEGCLRLYEGALYTLSLFLDHRPDLVKTIKEKMAKAQNATKVSEKAFALREGLDAIMAIGVAAAPKPTPTPTPTPTPAPAPTPSPTPTPAPEVVPAPKKAEEGK
jgi:hypothetical protein